MERAELPVQRKSTWYVRRSKLSGTDLTQAFTFGAKFTATDLSGVKGLTQVQLDVACRDAKTKLPPGLKTPASWPCDE